MNRTGQQMKKPTATNTNATQAESKKATEETEESNSTNLTSTNANANNNNNAKDEDDIYEFKGTPKDSSSDDKSDTGKASDKSSDEKSSSEGDANAQTANNAQPKRPFAEVETPDESNNAETDENKRKKRKEAETAPKEAPVKSTTGIRIPIRQEKGTKVPGPASKTIGIPNKTATADKKSPCPSPKPVANKSVDSDAEQEETKTVNDGPKVPPLKIVIPQQNASGDQETGNLRNGKNASARIPALPYVVASSNSNDSNADKESSSSRCASPVDPIKVDEKCDKNPNERPPRVLRSHRGGQSGSSSADRSSNNSSPQLQNNSSTPSPAPPGDEKANQQNSSSNTNSPANATQTTEQEKETSTPSPANTTSNTTSNTTTTHVNSNELHPRKRKIRASKEQQAAAAANQESKPSVDEKPDTEIHPHDQPITNCYQMYINLRKQIDRRIHGLFPVQPKPPQGFKDYLLNRRTYVLQGKTPTEPTLNIPQTVASLMKDLYTAQEKERYKLKMQHIVEKEKLVLAVEQEILRVHGRAARALANQSLPFSVCSILKDEDVYNMITPEQEQKDLNARSRYNGRLFLSWLQDVDDKWEKIKEAMLLRHHNEAESLHAVQLMDWEWKLKENSLCEWKSKPEIDETHVPQVHVSDDFDLLPA